MYPFFPKSSSVSHLFHFLLLFTLFFLLVLYCFFFIVFFHYAFVPVLVASIFIPSLLVILSVSHVHPLFPVLCGASVIALFLAVHPSSPSPFTKLWYSIIFQFSKTAHFSHQKISNT